MSDHSTLSCGISQYTCLSEVIAARATAKNSRLKLGGLLKFLPLRNLSDFSIKQARPSGVMPALETVQIPWKAIFLYFKIKE
jgi:hypothetical protein